MVRLLAFAALVAALLADALLTNCATVQPPAITGHWNVRLSDPHAAAAFELHHGLTGYWLDFQGPWGVPVRVSKVQYANSRISFVVPGLGPFVGRFEPAAFQTGAFESVVTSSTQWSAVRAPVLRSPKPHWGPRRRLFDGVSLAGWKHRRSLERESWSVVDSMLVNRWAGDDLVTSERFEDFQLHLEYRLEPNSDSGVHLRGRYEIQITDRLESGTREGMSGSVYGYAAPAVAAELPAGQWNSLDVTLVGRKLTALLNGRRIHNHRMLECITGDALDSDEAAPGPIMLQGYLGSVAFRNIEIAVPL